MDSTSTLTKALDHLDKSFLGVGAQLLPAVAVCLLLYFTTLAVLRRRPTLWNKAPALVDEGYPILGAFRFWTARWDFFRQSQAKSPLGNFSFFIGKHPVVGMSSDETRKVFFESKQFGLTEGYSVLFGMYPTTRVENAEGEDVFNTSEFSQFFKDRILRFVRRENFLKNLPTLIADTRGRLQDLLNDPRGITDPFDSIYKLVYLLTVRTVACNEIARDRKLLDITLGLYETVAQSATAAVIIFPWFPSISLIKRYVAGARLYLIVRKIVSKRKKSGTREDDALQYMIDQGDDMGQIIGVIMGSLFAAQQNSGINVAWILCHLAHNPDWAAKARDEVQTVVRRYFPDEHVPLVERLSMLPLVAWESEFPIMELCLRDSIRLHSLGACFRRNISGKDIQLAGDEVIQDGAFASYHMNNIHLDPAVYQDPLKWDPARYLPDRAEDQKKPHAWVGFGAGRHPCLGIRFAKLEQNIITAFFLTIFDFVLSDSKGNAVDSPPGIDLNMYSSWKPQPPIYLRYSRRVKE